MGSTDGFTLRGDDVLARALRGAAAGTVATLPMTLVLGVQAALTERQLAPERVTEGLAHRVGLEPDDRTLDVATTVNHLAYGAGMGALYGVLRGRRRAGRGAVVGTAFGVAVWFVSYTGWIPAVGILPPPTRDDVRRQSLTHLAHWVYGAVLGVLDDRWRRA